MNLVAVPATAMIILMVNIELLVRAGGFVCRDMTLTFARNYERELLKHKAIQK